MTLRESLDRVVAVLPEDRLRELVEFAQFLASRSEQIEWQAFGRSQFAAAYGPDEPEYTLADVKS